MRACCPRLWVRATASTSTGTLTRRRECASHSCMAAAWATTTGLEPRSSASRPASTRRLWTPATCRCPPAPAGESTRGSTTTGRTTAASRSRTVAARATPTTSPARKSAPRDASLSRPARSASCPRRKVGAFPRTTSGTTTTWTGGAKTLSTRAARETATASTPGSSARTCAMPPGLPCPGTCVPSPSRRAPAGRPSRTGTSMRRRAGASSSTTAAARATPTASRPGGTASGPASSGVRRTSACCPKRLATAWSSASAGTTTRRKASAGASTTEAATATRTTLPRTSSASGRAGSRGTCSECGRFCCLQSSAPCHRRQARARTGRSAGSTTRRMASAGSSTTEAAWATETASGRARTARTGAPVHKICVPCPRFRARAAAISSSGSTTPRRTCATSLCSAAARATPTASTTGKPARHAAARGHHCPPNVHRTRILQSMPVPSQSSPARATAFSRCGSTTRASTSAGPSTTAAARATTTASSPRCSASGAA
ncbi:unnamed protein product [Ixodes pacificus]